MNDHEVMDFLARRARRDECEQACMGIADPRAAIEGAREALDRAKLYVLQNHHEDTALVEDLDAALALLTPGESDE